MTFALIEYFRKINVPIISSHAFTRFRGSLAFIVFTVSMAIFTDIFLYGVVVPVIPFEFERRMGVSHDSIQIKVSENLAIYAAGLIVGSLIFGYICDRVNGRRLPMLSGLIVLIAAIVILCVTKSLALFMFGRFLLGFSSGVVWACGLAIIADSAPSNRVAHLMGYPAIGMNMGVFFGPLLGGIVYEKAGYYAVWYVCFGIVVLDILLRMLMIENKDLPRKLAKFNIPSDVEEQNESKSNEIADSRVQEVEITSEEPIDSTSGTTEVNKKKRKWKLPAIFLLLSSARVLNCLLQNFVMSWMMTAFDTTLTLHLNKLFGFNSLEAGLVFLAIAGPAILDPLAGYVADRWGPRYLSTAGFVFMGVFTILLRLPDHDSTSQIVLFVVILALAGCCIACVYAPIFGELAAVTTEIESKNPGAFGRGRGFGQVFALFNISYSLGGLVGPFEAGGVINDHGWNLATLSMGIACFGTVIPVFLFTGGNLVTKWWSSRKGNYSRELEDQESTRPDQQMISEQKE